MAKYPTVKRDGSANSEGTKLYGGGRHPRVGCAATETAITLYGEYYRWSSAARCLCADYVNSQILRRSEHKPGSYTDMNSDTSKGYEGRILIL